VTRATGPQSGRRWTADAGLAAVLVLFGIVTVPYIESFRDVDRPVGAVGLALIVLTGAVLVARRRWPVVTLVVAAASTSAYLLLGYPYGPIMFSLAIAVYSVARRRPPLEASLWCGAALVVLLLHLLTNDAALPGVYGLLPGSAWVTIPFTIGVARRLVAEAGSRERAEAERRLVDAERLRLAQEVHDVVGHGLAAIQMQADIALHLQQTRPGQAHIALEAISRASSDALAELRATLAAISPDGPGADGPGSDGESRAPTPGLARVDTLRQRVEDAGVTVEVAVHGQPRKLPAAVDLAAYRVLQESLTNVVKHSPHPKARVEIAYRPDEITLTVANQDLVAGSHIEGFGISGMRRRVAHLGGNLAAGPGGRPGMFEVRATIPT
jgi:signal transduction histidine kinase